MTQKVINFGQYFGYFASISWIILRSPLKYLFIIALIIGLMMKSFPHAAPVVNTILTSPVASTK